MSHAPPVSLLAVFAVLAVIPACGSGGSGEAASRGTGGATGTGTESRGAASYRVPVTAELEPWARYPVEEVKFEREGSRVTIRYPFPEWLSGDDEEIELEGEYADGSFAVTAEQGSGTCTRTTAGFECSEHLPGLGIDREEARESMEDAGLRREEIAERLKVTSVFAADPIGILEFGLAR